MKPYVKRGKTDARDAEAICEAVSRPTMRFIWERPQNFVVLDADASRTAGLPTATDIIWNLKRRYYCEEENEDISRRDVQLEAVRSSIQSYMASMGFPAQSAPEEYST